MTLADWKEVLDVVKLFLECGAIIGAGLWATYTFGSLGQIARAHAEIANAEAARRKTEAETQALTEHSRVGAVIEIELSASAFEIPGQSGLLLSVIAEVCNKGGRNAQIDYPEKPFTAYSVQVGESGEQTYVPVANAAVRSSSAPSKRSLKLLVRAGGRERIPFLVRVPGPGLYFLVLSLPLSGAEEEIAKLYGLQKTRWSAKRYFVAAVPAHPSAAERDVLIRTTAPPNPPTVAAPNLPDTAPVKS